MKLAIGLRSVMNVRRYHRMRIGELREELYHMRRIGNIDERSSCSTILGIIDGIDDSFVVAKMARATQMLLSYVNNRNESNGAIEILRRYLDMEE